jgi:hypothetical protein
MIWRPVGQEHRPTQADVAARPGVIFTRQVQPRAEQRRRWCWAWRRWRRGWQPALVGALQRRRAARRPQRQPGQPLSARSAARPAPTPSCRRSSSSRRSLSAPACAAALCFCWWLVAGGCWCGGPQRQRWMWQLPGGRCAGGGGGQGGWGSAGGDHDAWPFYEFWRRIVERAPAHVARAYISIIIFDLLFLNSYVYNTRPHSALLDISRSLVQLERPILCGSGSDSSQW